MPIETIHRLSAEEAHSIKSVILKATETMGANAQPEYLAEQLIAAFAQIDQATAQPDPAAKK